MIRQQIFKVSGLLAAKETGYSVEAMTNAIVQTFIERAEAEGEGYLESVVHQSTKGDDANLDSRTYTSARARL